MIGLGKSQGAGSYSCEPTSLVHECPSDSVSEQNSTVCTTPDLPFSESSDLLDIPYASLFDLMEFSEAPENLISPNRAVTELENGYDSTCNEHFGSPILEDITHFPHSHAVYLLSNEDSSVLTEDLSASSENSSLSYTDLYTRKSPLGPLLSTNVYTKPEKIGSCTKALHQQHLVIHEPMTVCFPSQSEAKFNKFTPDSHDYSSTNNYKHHIRDTCIVRSRNEPENCPVYQHIPATDSKSIVQSLSAEVNPSLLSLAPGLPESNEAQPCFLQCSAFDDIVQHTHTKEQEPQATISLINHAGNHDFSSNNSPWSYHELPEAPNTTTNHLTGNFHYNASTGNGSWSYYNLPEAMQNNMSNTSACNNNTRKDVFITTRPKQQQRPQDTPKDHENGSASKRRKCNYNYKAAQHVNTRQQNKTSQTVRQRLLFKSPPKCRHSDSPDTVTASPQSASARDTMSRDNHGSFSLRSLMLQKENDFQSRCHDIRSPRQPFTELRNSNIPATFLKSLTTPTRKYAEYNKTSQGIILPSRKEELLSRDAYYCDFTVDRQHKIDAYMSRKTHASNLCDEIEVSHHTPSVNDSFVRKVEGAESSPSSFVFQAPPANRRAPRAAAHVNKQRLRSKVNIAAPNKWPLSRPFESDKNNAISGASLNPQQYSQTHIVKNIPGIDHSKKESSTSCNKRRQSRTRCSSKSTWAPPSKSCTTHPIASSTMLLDSSSCSADTEAGGYSTCSDNENTSSWDLGKLDFYNTTEEKENEMVNKRPLRSVGKECSKHFAENVQDMRSFEISAMVSRIDQLTNHSRLIPGKRTGEVMETFTTGIRRGSRELEVSKSRTNMVMSHQQILAGAQSFLKTVDRAPTNLTIQEAESSQSSNTANKKGKIISTFSNNAEASILYTPSERSDIPDREHFSDELVLSKHVSISEPDLCEQTYREYEEMVGSLNNPDDTDPTPAMFENERYIPGKSRSSDGSCYSTVRCRGRPVNVLPEKHLPTQCNIQSGQDLLDSILTDSPRSVNSSGIFAPDNSYTIPTERAYHGDGHSITSGDSTLLNINLVSTGTSPSNLISSSTSNSNLVSTGTSTSNLVSTGTSTSNLVSSSTSNPNLVSSSTSNPNLVLSSTSNPNLVSSSTSNPNLVSSSTSNPNLVSPSTSNPNLVSSSTSKPNLVSTGTSTSSNPTTIWPRFGRVLLAPNLICEKNPIFVNKSEPAAESLKDNRKFKHPYPSASVVNSIRNLQLTTSQDTIASSSSLTQHRTLSVKSDPVDKKSVFAVTPGVVTGPPKIRSKNSLVRKFRKFSSNFFKKTEKIKILANL